MAADALEYVPTAQSVHVLAPALGLYLPGMQPLHSLFSPDQPALQEQSVISTLRDTEYEFAGHRMHSDPSSTEYLPASQFTQVTVEFEFAGHLRHSDLSFARYQSAMHLQALRAPLPTAECEFAGHKRQSDLSSAVYLPASQFVHVLVNPNKYSENFPTAH